MTSRPYPYNMGWDDLKPEPLSFDFRDEPALMLRGFKDAKLNNDELHRIHDAALGLAMKMVLDPEYAGWSRGQILAVALDTALTWERG